MIVRYWLLAVMVGAVGCAAPVPAGNGDGEQGAEVQDSKSGESGASVDADGSTAVDAGLADSNVSIPDAPSTDVHSGTDSIDGASDLGDGGPGYDGQSEDGVGDTELGGADLAGGDAGDTADDSGTGDIGAQDVPQSDSDASPLIDTYWQDIAQDTDSVGGSDVVKGGVGPDFDDVATITLVGGADTANFTFGGPGLPTALPEVSPPIITPPFEDFYQCDEDVPLPKGSDVPGPCYLVHYNADKSPADVHTFTYDCSGALRVERSWFIGANGTLALWQEDQHDWTTSGKHAREEGWGSWWGSGWHQLDTWSYYDDGRLKSFYSLIEDLDAGKATEDVYEYDYVVSDGGETVQKSVHRTLTTSYTSGTTSKLEQKGLTIYHHNEDGLLVESEHFGVDLSSGELILGHKESYSYDASGRTIFYWHIPAAGSDGYYSAFHDVYLDLEIGVVKRHYWTDSPEKSFEPIFEEVYDNEGRRLLLRQGLDYGSLPQNDCPYGPCWLVATGVVIETDYNELGNKTRELHHGSDLYKVAGKPGVELTAYDEFARPTAVGYWGLDADKLPYHLLSLTTRHYDCWDNSAALDMEQSP